MGRWVDVGLLQQEIRQRYSLPGRATRGSRGGARGTSREELIDVADSSKGLYDHLYRRFFEKRDTHQGYEFQHAPPGNVPPPVTQFIERLKWWTLRGWRRKKILAERDRVQREIVEIKKSSTR